MEKNQTPKSEVGPLPACSGVSASDKLSVSASSAVFSSRKASKYGHDSQEIGIESEVETQVSDGSELPSSASAVAAMQLELTGSSNTTNDIGNVSILSEVQRLRQENQALRSENAELRRSPPQTPMATIPPTECGSLAYGNGSPAACQQNLRFGAPLRYLVVSSPMGMNPGHFEFGFDSNDAQNQWRCS